VYSPAYRVDILHPVDLVEDVAMAYGYERLGHDYMPPLHPGSEAPIERFSRAVREVMVGLGFQEVNNYMMTNKRLLYSMMGLLEQPTVEVENPRHEAYSCLRTWLLPQLLQTLSRSRHAAYPQRIFEVGDVAIPDERYDVKVREERRLAYAITDDGVTFTDAHSALDALMGSIGLGYPLEMLVHPSLIPGRAAAVVVRGRRVGIIGEVHPAVLERFQLTKPVAVAELNLGELMGLVG